MSWSEECNREYAKGILDIWKMTRQQRQFWTLTGGVGVEVTKGLEDARIVLNKRRSPLASKLAGLVIANQEHNLSQVNNLSIIRHINIHDCRFFLLYD